MRRRLRLSGVTVVEATFAIAISTGLFLGIGATLGTTTRLAERSRGDLQASEENRWALDRLGNALRGAAADTMTGFDVSGVATAPRFSTVPGMAAGVRTLSTAATLQWQATPAVGGVTSPGQVVRVQDGVTTVVAKRVPSGGFTVTQVGGGLLIHLESFAPMSNGEISHAAGDTFVRLRN